METSYNGWPASKDPREIHLTALVIDGVGFLPGVRGGDVHTVLGYVAQQYHERIEPLQNPGCWGYAYRTNRNANNLSCHASATAIDCNAPKHPNGVATTKTFTRKQITEIHKILREVDGVVNWGGDFRKTPDAMHFEIAGTMAEVAAVARKIEMEEDVALSDEDKKWIRETIKDELRTLFRDESGKGAVDLGGARIEDPDNDGPALTLGRYLKATKVAAQAAAKQTRS